MAKMRGIKPETFTDDKILQLSPLARWLFVGMWTLACDNGHVEDNFVQLKVRILPMDSCDMAELISELVSVGLLERCSGYLKIPNLPKHQKIDRRFLLFCKWCAHDEHASFDPGDKLPRTASKSSAHDVQDPLDTTDTSGARSAHDVQSPGAHRVHVDEGEGEGEGERSISVDPVDEPQAELIEEPPSATASDMFERFWQSYPKRTPHSNPKKPAREKFLQIAKKTDPQLLIDAARAYAKIRRGQDPHFTAQAIKWLRDERWNDEVVVPIRPKAQPSPQAEFVPLLQRHQETIQRRKENG